MRSTAKLGRARTHAEQHHDLLTTAVLRSEGLTWDEIANLVEDRLLERIIRGLYRIAGTRTPVQDIAAALQRHPRARASYVSGLFLHDFDVVAPPEPQLVLPPGSSSSNRLGELHRSPLPASDCTRRKRLPVTTVARSIVDSAESLDVEALARVVNEGITRRVTTLELIVEVAERLEAAPGRIGGGRMRRVLATWTDAMKPDSMAEAAAIRLIRLAGLPSPATQHVIEDADGSFVARVDLAWPDQKVVREYDSFQWHRVDSVEHDEGRRQAIERLGWSIAPLHRHHLVPGERRWLDELAGELRLGEHRAS
ncbi:MAG: type IV toxin-antitoxin system AbiEi family antitoxin domain-containing protein [Acidimicrobiales bacterium]|nr:type IV toxin-antitoxin system AbiEi family antitoxin domain-containing protein [Acidimicrobiales bacterium]